MRHQLGESGARGRVRHELRLGLQAAMKAPHVRYGDRILEKGEHRRIVRRIADVDHARVVDPEIDSQALPEEELAHGELIVAPEPAIDMYRAHLGGQALLAHE